MGASLPAGMLKRPPLARNHPLLPHLEPLLHRTEPSGHSCAADIIDQYTVVHIMLKGLIDFSLEVARLQKDLKLAEGRHEKLKKKMDAPKYRSNCPASQQEEDAAKLLEIEGELESMRSVIATFEANQEDVALQ